MSSDSRIPCAWVERNLEAWVDGELARREHARLERHLEQCAGCTNAARLAGLVREALQEMPIVACPPRVSERVEAIVRNAPPSLHARKRNGHRSLADFIAVRARVFTRPALAVMTGIVLAIGAAGVWNQTHEPRFSNRDIEHARRDARVAFAYLGRYSRRTGTIVSRDVMAERVVAPVRHAVRQSGHEVAPRVEKAVLDALFVDTKPESTVSNLKGDRR